MATAKMSARSGDQAALDAVVESGFLRLTIYFFGSTLHSSGVTLVGKRCKGAGAFSYLVFASINLL
jgi:hypothetical protein